MSEKSSREIMDRYTRAVIEQDLAMQDKLRYACSGCTRTMTPDSSHIEAPARADYTLGQFFTVWGQPLSRDQVLGVHISPEEEVRVLVNGQAQSGDPRTVQLAAHEEIVVQLGPPFPSPQPFSFPPGS